MIDLILRGAVALIIKTTKHSVSYSKLHII